MNPASRQILPPFVVAIPKFIYTHWKNGCVRKVGTNAACECERRRASTMEETLFATQIRDAEFLLIWWDDTNGYHRHRLERGIGALLFVLGWTVRHASSSKKLTTPD